MKKYFIILIILSMCGGTAESDLDSLAEVSSKAKEVMSEAQKESQEKYKESQNTLEKKQLSMMKKQLQHLF